MGLYVFVFLFNGYYIPWLLQWKLLISSRVMVTRGGLSMRFLRKESYGTLQTVEWFFCIQGVV